MRLIGTAAVLFLLFGQSCSYGCDIFSHRKLQARVNFETGRGAETFYYPRIWSPGEAWEARRILIEKHERGGIDFQEVKGIFTFGKFDPSEALSRSFVRVFGVQIASKLSKFVEICAKDFERRGGKKPEIVLMVVRTDQSKGTDEEGHSHERSGPGEGKFLTYSKTEIGRSTLVDRFGRSLKPLKEEDIIEPDNSHVIVLGDAWHATPYGGGPRLSVQLQFFEY